MALATTAAVLTGVIAYAIKEAIKAGVSWTEIRARLISDHDLPTEVLDQISDTVTDWMPTEGGR